MIDEFVLPVKFWEKTELGPIASEELGRCLIWTRYISPKGYGQCNLGPSYPKMTKAVHVLVYIEAFGAVPDGLEVSHLCHNRRCVRIGHLVAETHAENIARKKRVEVCPSGHTEYLTRKNGHRECKVCATERRKRYPSYYDPAKRRERYLKLGK